MTLTKKINHVTEAISNLIEQFKNKTNWPKVLTAFIQQIQDLEDMHFELIEIPDLESGIGVQLDVIGRIVDEDRKGRSDADYRIAIRGRILVNKSEGTPIDILDLLEILSGAGIELTEYPPASYVAYLLAELASEDEGEQIAVLMKDATAAGVNGSLVYSSDPVSERFQFDTSGQGFDQGKYVGVT